MITVRIEPEFKSWRQNARKMLQRGVSPEKILWDDGTGAGESLFAGLEEDYPDLDDLKPIELRISRSFLELAQYVACHRSEKRWSLLYRALWRLTLGNQPHLFQQQTDEDVRRLEEFAKAVRRDRHKMKAFVRFKKLRSEPESAEEREQFVAWFEPTHRIVELTAPFFRKRFSGMNWSILTPEKCAHWDGETLSFTPGVPKAEAPTEDSLDEYWKTYYANIFNPARLKLKAMQAEMPVKYWKNLPEAPLIHALTTGAANRTDDMIVAETSSKTHVSDRVPAGVPEPAPEIQEISPELILRESANYTLTDLSSLAAECRACPLHSRSTQTVFGAGPENASIMIVGEQPGDLEDLSGKPFCGPSGELLNRALEEIQVPRASIYVTNVVKHFKWKRSGKRRLHQNPSRTEVHTCRPWVLAEIATVRPDVLICLGGTAAKALIQPGFQVKKQRGLVDGCDHLAPVVIATIHPSFLLRLKNKPEKIHEWNLWLRDLKKAENSFREIESNAG